MKDGRYCIGGFIVTQKQRDVWKGLAESETLKSLGPKIGLTAKGAEYHRYRLYERLGVHDVAALTRMAVKFGLVK